MKSKNPVQRHSAQNQVTQVVCVGSFMYFQIMSKKIACSNYNFFTSDLTF